MHLQLYSFAKYYFSYHKIQILILNFNISKGGWVRGWSRRSSGNGLQHQEAHPAGLHLPDDHPYAFQQQREVNL